MTYNEYKYNKKPNIIKKWLHGSQFKKARYERIIQANIK